MDSPNQEPTQISKQDRAPRKPLTPDVGVGEKRPADEMTEAESILATNIVDISRKYEGKNEILNQFADLLQRTFESGTDAEALDKIRAELKALDIQSEKIIEKDVLAMDDVGHISEIIEPDVDVDGLNKLDAFQKEEGIFDDLESSGLSIADENAANKIADEQTEPMNLENRLAETDVTEPMNTASNREEEADTTLLPKSDLELVSNNQVNRSAEITEGDLALEGDRQLLEDLEKLKPEDYKLDSKEEIDRIEDQLEMLEEKREGVRVQYNKKLEQGIDDENLKTAHRNFNNEIKSIKESYKLPKYQAVIMDLGRARDNFKQRGDDDSAQKIEAKRREFVDHLKTETGIVSSSFSEQEYKAKNDPFRKDEVYTKTFTAENYKNIKDRKKSQEKKTPGQMESLMMSEISGYNKKLQALSEGSEYINYYERDGKGELVFESGEPKLLDPDKRYAMKLTPELRSRLLKEVKADFEDLSASYATGSDPMPITDPDSVLKQEFASVKTPEANMPSDNRSNEEVLQKLSETNAIKPSKNEASNRDSGDGDGSSADVLDETDDLTDEWFGEAKLSEQAMQNLEIEGPEFYDKLGAEKVTGYSYEEYQAEKIQLEMLEEDLEALYKQYPSLKGGGGLQGYWNRVMKTPGYKEASKKLLKLESDLAKSERVLGYIHGYMEAQGAKGWRTKEDSKREKAADEAPKGLSRAKRNSGPGRVIKGVT